MESITKVDKNFMIHTNLPEDVCFYDCFSAPFTIHGLYLDNEDNVFTRLPEAFMLREDINEAIKYLMHDTAGGRIKFATDSPYVVVAAELLHVMNMMHMPATGHSGIDLYSCEVGNKDYTYKKTFMPKGTHEEKDRWVVGLCEMGAYDNYKTHEILLNLPLYNGLKSVKIGIKKGCHIFAPIPYKIDKPIVYYGGSCVQGGCASRPGNTHMGHISRILDCDYVNLGFSGSGRGEKEMAEYIASREMSVFILGYDANVRTIEELKNTHYNFYKIVRERNKDLPIIITSQAKYRKRKAWHYFGQQHISESLIEHNKVIMDTYVRALREGDEHVYYVDGETLFGTEDQDFCTVDGLHPNDHGFYMWGKVLIPVIRNALNL